MTSLIKITVNVNVHVYNCKVLKSGKSHGEAPNGHETRVVIDETSLASRRIFSLN